MSTTITKAGIGRLLDSRWSEDTRDALVSLVASGDTESLVKAAQTFGGQFALASAVRDRADTKAGVAGAYAVFAADKAGWNTAKITEALGGVVPSRVSQLRKTARMIFELSIDPETDPEWAALVRAQNSKVVGGEIAKDGATRESVLAAVRREYDINPDGTYVKRSAPEVTTGEGEGSRGAGAETAAEKTPPALSNGAPRGNPARIDAMEALLGEIVLGQDERAEWNRLLSFYNRLETWLEESPANPNRKAEGSK